MEDVSCIQIIKLSWFNFGKEIFLSVSILCINHGLPVITVWMLLLSQYSFYAAQGVSEFKVMKALAMYPALR